MPTYKLVVELFPSFLGVRTGGNIVWLKDSEFLCHPLTQRNTSEFKQESSIHLSRIGCVPSSCRQVCGVFLTSSFHMYSNARHTIHELPSTIYLPNISSSINCRSPQGE